MFNNLYSVFETITSFSNNSDYTEQKMKYIKTLNYKAYESIITLINDQTKISNKTYSLYKQQYSTLKFECISEIINAKENEYHTIIDSIDDFLIMNALSPDCLANYILDNFNKKYIFLTLNYGSNLMKSSHQSALMIDNENKLIYMIDPNGKSTYFDGVFHEPTNFYIETILSKYFLELKKFGLEYKYMYSADWNTKKIAINKHFNNDIIGQGHCVITTLMLINLITLMDIKPNVAFEMLNKLSSDEIIFFIKEYSIGVYNILWK